MPLAFLEKDGTKLSGTFFVIESNGAKEIEELEAMDKPPAWSSPGLLAALCLRASESFDMREPPNLDVWSTLQTVVERTLGTEATIENQPGNAGSAASLTGNAKGGHPTSSIDSKDAVPSHKMTRVLFDHRRELGPMKGRMISNVEELLTACRRERAAVGRCWSERSLRPRGGR